MKKLSKLCKVFFLIFMLVATSYQASAQQNVKWSLWLEQPNQPAILVGELKLTKAGASLAKTINQIQVKASVRKADGYFIFNASASARKSAKVYFSLRGTYQAGTIYSFTGAEPKEKILRQSPHNPLNHTFDTSVMQELPMAAIKDSAGFWVALSDAPAFYDNYTTQWLRPDEKEIQVNSGDNGKIISAKLQDATEKYYHTLKTKKLYVFNGIIFRSKAANKNNLRKDVLLKVAKWKNQDTTRFAATSFSSNYMLLRKNETKFSEYWVVPSISYSNKQYSRDSFWQSMVLPPEMQASCYLNEANQQSRGAERPLFVLIWAYRIMKQGLWLDTAVVRKSLNYIEAHVRDGRYYSNDDPAKKNFQSWYDLVAFEDDDVITYNQGLLAVALTCAKQLGMHPKITPDLATMRYREMFNEKGGYFPLSAKKDLLAVDPLVGDLLAWLLFDHSILPTSFVQRHYQTIIGRAKTPYGYKCTSTPNGSFAPNEAYSTSGFSVKVDGGGKEGNYQQGGSWYLYDMLFLIDSYLHKVPGSMQEIVWRGSLDFKLGGTYFEFINTVTGVPNKPNQGWNGSIYAIMKQLIDKKIAGKELFAEINQVK
jgi:hypothetical protein